MFDFLGSPVLQDKSCQVVQALVVIGETASSPILPVRLHGFFYYFMFLGSFYLSRGSQRLIMGVYHDLALSLLSSLWENTREAKALAWK